jgi:Macroglobulin domain MG4
VSVSAYKNNGNNPVFVRAQVLDALGQPVPNAPVTVVINNQTTNPTTDASGRICVQMGPFPGGSVNGIISVNGPTCFVYNQPFQSQNGNPHGCP